MPMNLALNGSNASFATLAVAIAQSRRIRPCMSGRAAWVLPPHLRMPTAVTISSRLRAVREGQT